MMANIKSAQTVLPLQFLWETNQEEEELSVFLRRTKQAVAHKCSIIPELAPNTEETKSDSTAFCLPDWACARRCVRACARRCVSWLGLDAVVAASYNGWTLNTA